MMIKKIIIGLLCLSLTFGASGCSIGKTPLKILSSDGSIMAEPKRVKAISKDKNHAYLEIVFDEAVNILTDIKGYSKTEAEKQL